MAQDVAAISSKDELLAFSVISWQELVSDLDRLSASQWTEPKDAAGWSVQDHVAHITQWDRALTRQLRDGKPMQQSLGATDAAWGPADFTAINETVRQTTLNDSIATVIADRDAAWAELLALLHGMSDEQLAAPVNASGLAVGNTELTGSVLDELVQCLGVHYTDHRQYIAAIVTAITSNVNDLEHRESRGSYRHPLFPHFPLLPLREAAYPHLHPMHAGALPHVRLHSGFSTFTFARSGSCRNHRPLGDSATPGSNSSESATCSARLPVSLSRIAASPSCKPRAAASTGVQHHRRRAGPPRQLGDIGEAGVHRPGRRRREEAQTTLRRPFVRPGLRQARKSIGLRLSRGDLDLPTRRGERQVGELHHRLGRGRHGAPRCQLREIRHQAGGVEPGRNDLRIGLVQFRLGVAHRPRQSAEDLLVRQRLARRLRRFHLRRERQVEVGREQVIELEETRCRQDEIGQSRRYPSGRDRSRP